MKYGIDEAYRNMIDLIKKNCQQINCKSHNSVNDYKKMVFFQQSGRRSIFQVRKEYMYKGLVRKYLHTIYACLSKATTQTPTYTY